ncbi:MAG: flavin reductase family protein [Gammaproteobacteria bacterium]|nr:flavin reductase family protein [Gammaproteobacteria bacterium]
MNTDAVTDDQFKQAMAQFPSGVTIVTTVANDEQFGFTASAFSSLSLSPPLILVCLANNADCFKPFNAGEQFAVNIIDAKHEKLAMKFATKGCDKFSGGEFVLGSSGLPILSGTPVALECRTKYTYPGGDHIILVGQVEYLTINDGTPTIWYAGGFQHLGT